jgi:hypothetical protein
MKEYQVNIQNSGKDCQEVIKNFLFKESSTVRFSAVNWGFIFKKGGLKDRKFQQVLNTLAPFFIVEEILDTRIGELNEFIEQKSHNYYYRLSKELKAALKEENLLFGINSAAISKNFYGFEDPTFLDNHDYIIGKFISHESYIFLFLAPDQKQKLIKQGIEFY